MLPEDLVRLVEPLVREIPAELDREERTDPVLLDPVLVSLDVLDPLLPNLEPFSLPLALSWSSSALPSVHFHQVRTSYVRGIMDPMN